ASAVVSDVIDAIKHKGKNIITIWSGHKLELLNVLQAKNNFFVRVPEKEKETAKKLFSALTPVVLTTGEAVEGEYAFLTGEITEGEFEEKAAGLSVISRIRADF
nr:homoserine dehydrogenase [Lachnospiraceae bacterium]